MAGHNRQPGSGVTSKLFAILDAFTDGELLSASTVVRRTGLPMSTVHRLIGELVGWGGLERRAGPKYAIGMKLWRIGTLSPGHRDLREIALPFMHDLAVGTRENVHLAVIDGDDALFIEKLSSHDSLPVRSYVGARMPLHATGAGKALLAFSSPAYQRRFLAERLTRLTQNTVTAPGLLAQSLTTIRRTGIAVAYEEMCLGSVSVAAPITDAEGNAIAALSVVSRSSPYLSDRFGPAVRTAANGVGREVRRLAEDGSRRQFA